jgi:group I intron endonuclease
MGWGNPPHILVKPGEAMNNCGVYAIKNKINGHCYIGSSHNIQNRWYQHKTLLRQGKHGNPHLQKAWLKYGEDNFEFIILLNCQSNELVENEQNHIDNCNPEYNIVPFARTGRGNLGRNRPDNIARNKTFRSRGHTGCPHSPETRTKMAAAWVERKKIGFSNETRAKMSVASKGRTLSPEARAKISATLMGHPASCLRDKKTGRFIEGTA